MSLLVQPREIVVTDGQQTAHRPEHRAGGRAGYPDRRRQEDRAHPPASAYAARRAQGGRAGRGRGGQGARRGNRARRLIWPGRASLGVLVPANGGHHGPFGKRLNLPNGPWCHGPDPMRSGGTGRTIITPPGRLCPVPVMFLSRSCGGAARVLSSFMESRRIRRVMADGQSTCSLTFAWSATFTATIGGAALCRHRLETTRFRTKRLLDLPSTTDPTASATSRGTETETIAG